MGEGRIRVRTGAQPIDDLGAREHLALGVEDRAAQQAASGGDHLRVVAARGQRLGLDDLPPHDAAGDEGKAEDQVEPKAADVGGDHGAGSASLPMALRWLTARSSPIMMKLASTLDPP